MMETEKLTSGHFGNSKRGTKSIPRMKPQVERLTVPYISNYHKELRSPLELCLSPSACVCLCVSLNVPFLMSVSVRLSISPHICVPPPLPRTRRRVVRVRIAGSRQKVFFDGVVDFHFLLDRRHLGRGGGGRGGGLRVPKQN